MTRAGFVFYVLLGASSLLAWTLPFRPLAALSMAGGNTDNLNCGSATSLDDMNAFTYYAWVYLAANPGNGEFRGLFHKAPTTNATGKGFFVYRTGGKTRLRTLIERSTATANAISDLDLGTGGWRFVALTYDETDGPRLWQGDLTTSVAEVSYSSGPTAGSGATSTDASANLYLLNRCPNNACSSESWPGRVAVAGIYRRRLSALELRLHQFRPHCQSPDCKLFTQLGWTGTGTQGDLSGNNNGCSTTGAFLADHVPIAR